MNDEELDALLAPNHLDDAGFTEKVVAHLPPPRRRAPRFAILFAAFGLGTGIAVLAAPRGLVTLMESIQHTQSSVAPAGRIVPPCVVLVLTGAALSEATSRA